MILLNITKKSHSHEANGLLEINRKNYFILKAFLPGKYAEFPNSSSIRSN